MGGESRHVLRRNSISMGNNFNDNWPKRQQSSGDWMVIHSNVWGMQYPYLKRTIDMAQIKWALIVADILGIPIYVVGFIANLDNIRSAILFLVALTWAMFRLYYFVVQRKQAVRDKELDLWQKEQDKQDRINQNKKQ